MNCIVPKCRSAYSKAFERRKAHKRGWDAGNSVTFSAEREATQAIKIALLFVV